MDIKCTIIGSRSTMKYMWNTKEQNTKLNVEYKSNQCSWHYKKNSVPSMDFIHSMIRKYGMQGVTLL